MTSHAPARIFISYSRKDGVDFAHKLRAKLLAQGFSIWQDLVALEGGRDWWSQIETALRSKALQHFILIVTQQALAGPIVRREIRLARQEGKTFCPIAGPGFDDLGKLPRWFGQVYNLDIPEHRTTLHRVLAADRQVKRVPMMAEEPPDDFVERPAEFNALKYQLLDTNGDAVARTVALRGASGYGKTTLARALAHDPDIQDAYFDGILWVELGQQGRGHIVSLIADLVGLLGENKRDFSTIDGARAALGDLRILLVIDDLWYRADLAPFMHGGPNTSRLITTRFAAALFDDITADKIAAMKGGDGGEAWKLIASGLPEDQVAAAKPDLVKLADRRHNWPQALRLANGFLRTRMGLSKYGARACGPFMPRPRALLATAITAANEGLNVKGDAALDRSRLRPSKDAQGGYDLRHMSVAESMVLNLSLLADDHRARYFELCTFPEHVDVPIGIAARLWEDTGGLDRHETDGLLAAYDDASLLLDLDFSRGIFRFHDSAREYLQDNAGKDGIAALHKRLAHAMSAIGGEKQVPAAEVEYFYRHLPQHLAHAGDHAAVDALLLDPGWLKAKLAATNTPHSLIADYEQFGHGPLHNLISRALRLATGVCSRNQRQLLPQLLCRLNAFPDDPAAAQFLTDAHRQLDRPALLTQWPTSLTVPGAEIARLQVDQLMVCALALLPDGRLASGSYRDGTIRIWDMKSGIQTACLEGHRDGVEALALLPDGRLASGSRDKTLRLWDLKSGAETACLEGHEAGIHALALLPNGRVASGSDDGTIRLWDMETGLETGRLTSGGTSTNVLVLLPDGRLASAAGGGSGDPRILLWDVRGGVQTTLIGAQLGGVHAVSTLIGRPNARLASGSDGDGTIRIWDVESGIEAARLKGHVDGVYALAVLPDGRLASASNDRTIRLWDLESGTEIARLLGHDSSIGALAPLLDGRLASGSYDGTIRLWDVKRAETEPVQDVPGYVHVLIPLRRDRLAVSGDDTIRVWDLQCYSEIARMEGHERRVSTLALLDDGRLASGSNDGTIRLWELESGIETARFDVRRSVGALAPLGDSLLACAYGHGRPGDDHAILLLNLKNGVVIARLEGHQNGALALVALPDGRLASSSWDKTIRLWDLDSSIEIARVESHPRWVRTMVALPDDLLASGSDDGIIRLWDLKNSCAVVARLEGHERGVTTLALLADSRLASGSYDGTIRLWDLKKGSGEIARLDTDASILCIASLPDGRVAAGDALGRLLCVEVVE